MENPPTVSPPGLCICAEVNSGLFNPKDVTVNGSDEGSRSSREPDHIKTWTVAW